MNELERRQIEVLESLIDMGEKFLASGANIESMLDMSPPDQLRWVAAALDLYDVDPALFAKNFPPAGMTSEVRWSDTLREIADSLEGQP